MIETVPVLALVSFLGIVLLVLGLIHYYIWRRVVCSTTRWRSPGRRIGTWLIVAAFLLTALAQAAGLLLTREVAAPLAWIGFSWFGFAFYFVVLLLVGELIRLGVWILDRRKRAPVTAAGSAYEPVGVAAVSPRDSSGVRTVERHDRTSEPGVGDDSRQVSRRLFLSRSIAVGAGAAAASVAGYGMSRALGDPVVRRVPVQIAGLDPRLSGFRIAMFADAHLGTIRGRAEMEQLVDIINGTEPDLVAVLGDLVDGSVADLGRDVAPMADFQSLHGTFFVTGNHEYYSGAQDWLDYLPDLGVRVLRNERLPIERDGAAFDLAGVNDISGEEYHDGPDYEKALQGRPSDRPVVLLSHQPVTVDRAVEYGVDLQLSGHTHAGQMWPFHYVVALQQGAISGLSRVKDTQLYVNSGVGFWGPPIRVGADPEVTVIELRSGDVAG